MPSVVIGNNTSAVATESIGTGSASRPHVLMGWVRTSDGIGRANNPFMGSFRISGSSGETEGNIGYVTKATGDAPGRDVICLSIVNWSASTVTRVQFPDITQWYYVVLQFGSGSNSNTNMKIFNDSSLTKFIELNYFGYATVDNIVRYMGINNTNAATTAGAQFKHLRAFYSGAFTDAECIAQARSTAPVAHSTAVLWDAWPFDALEFTGSINNKVLKVTGTPRLAPDQPFVFINPTTLVTGSNSSVVQISTVGYAPVIIGAR